MAGLQYNSSPNLELVKTSLDKLRDNALLEQATTGRASATDALVFNQESADRAAVVTSVIGGGGYFKKTITGVAQDVTAKKQSDKTAAAPKTTIIAEFNKDIPISRNFMADQQHEAVAKAIRQETLSWGASRDKNAFNYYAFGFGTTLSTTIDSVAPFSNSHVNEHGDTVDNLETGVMSDANLNTGVVSLSSQKNQGGVIIGWEPKFLLVGSTLHHDAMIVSKSVDWTTDENDLYKYKLRAREEVDTIEYTGLVGSNGSA